MSPFKPISVVTPISEQEKRGLPGQNGLHGGDGSLQRDLQVPLSLGQPGSAEGSEQVSGTCEDRE